jgi:glycosyltransferase involved in cell wall biosynthesis
MDNSRTVLQPYFDRIKYVYQSNQGVAAARNLGVEIAQGELICFLDHDDIFMPHKLAAQVACLQENLEIGMIHSGWRRVNSIGNLIKDVKPWKKEVPVLDMRGWLEWMPVLFSAMMFRKDWLIKANGLDRQFKQTCDLDLVLRLSLMGCKTVWLKEVTVCYREHDRNDSLNTLVQTQECWAVLDKFFAQSDLPKNLVFLENTRRYHTLVWMAWRLYQTGHLNQMAQYLEQSLSYSQLPRTAIVLNWIERFKTHSLDYAGKFDLAFLLNTPQWKYLLGKIDQLC